MEALGVQKLIELLALREVTPSSPGVFKVIGSDSYIHVVMPKFVQW